MLRGLAAALLLVVTFTAVPAFAQGPSYQVASSGPEGIELRFHGIALRGVHADDNQNALSLDFQGSVDATVFDRLAGEFPAWVSMAYASFDNGIIRSPRPVTFLTRSEPDGFSLRIMGRGPQPNQPQGMQVPPPNAAGQYATPYGQPAPGPLYPPPQYPAQTYVPAAAQAGFHTYGEYAALRGYEAQELAIRPSNPVWAMAYGRATMQGDSGFTLGSEVNWFHGGDRMVATDLSAKFSFVSGVSLIGDAKWTDVSGRNVRQPAGTLSATMAKDIFTGDAGFALELGRDSEARLEGTVGNGTTGAKLGLYSGTPAGFGYLKLDFHNPYIDTPTAVAYRADVDRAAIGYGGTLGWNLWGSLSGSVTQYGVHADSNVARTAGWDGNLRWQTDVYGGLLAGISYDGHGEYRFSEDSRTGTAPTPFVPLGIRNMEDHAVTATLTTTMWNQLWFNAYAGYVVDRYASDGLLAGLDVHFTPTPGVDLALGVRQSAVSYVQGETGRQTTANLNFTLGFGAPPQPSWISNQL